MHPLIRLTKPVVCLFTFLVLSACDQNSPAPDIQNPDHEILPGKNLIDTARAIQADEDQDNWLLHGRNYAEQRYSPLSQINDQNVKQLGLAWHYDFDSRRGLEATPIVVDGRMYLTGTWSKVYAFDAATGTPLWQYDPKVPGEWGAKACCDVVNRGVAVWDNKVIVGTIDGRLIALDAATGEPVWEVLTIDKAYPYSITGAPRVIKDKVIIGNGGAEFGVRGYVTAYDTATGRQVWRFYTVPGDPSKPFENAAMEQAAKTWTGEWWHMGGGGTVWDSMAYDPELDLLYLGVGNGSPWNQKYRSPEGGDNLFLASIVAVRPDTGEYVWHYQTTPGETWDYTATQHIILADLEIDGRQRKVLMQAPKNGFFYVIDRETGEFISAEPFVPVTWASHYDYATGRPVENPEARFYATHNQPQFVKPSPLGAHNWQPMSYNPLTGLVYIPAQDMGYPFKSADSFTPTPSPMNVGLDMSVIQPPENRQAMAKMKENIKGHLAAWDPVTQKEVWRVQFPGPWNGGTLTTAGNLVFQGNAAGNLAAYRADTGKLLWSFPAQTGIVAPPITYRIGGEQYVSVLAGWGGVFALVFGEVAQISGTFPNHHRLLTFKLNGRDELPTSNIADKPLPKPPASLAGKDVIEKGRQLYAQYCSGCHGRNSVSASGVPDLRYSGLIHDNTAWSAVVGEGTLKDKGMIGFGETLSVDNISAIRSYVIARANSTYAGLSSP